MLTSDLLSALSSTGGHRPIAYSGRGTGTESCLGLRGESIQSVLSTLPMLEHMDNESLSWLLEHFAWDSFGMGVVVYWPKLHADEELIGGYKF